MYLFWFIFSFIFYFTKRKFSLVVGSKYIYVWGEAQTIEFIITYNKWQLLDALEVIPEEDMNDPDSTQASTARKLRKLLVSYEEKIGLSVPNYDDVHGKALLLAMGIKISDQVAYGEDKVAVNFDIHFF